MGRLRSVPPILSIPTCLVLFTGHVLFIGMKNPLSIFRGGWNDRRKTKQKRSTNEGETKNGKHRIPIKIKVCPVGDPHIWGDVVQKINLTKEKHYNDESIFTTRITRNEWRDGRLGLQ